MTTALAVPAARNLATTTKSAPQLAAVTPRWLLRMLPWTQVDGGTYRVNHRRSYRVDDGRVQFDSAGLGTVRVVAATLPELPLLRGYADAAALAALADRFEQRELAPGDPIAVRGEPSGELVLIARGRAERLVPAAYGGEASHGVLGRGDHVGDLGPRWRATVRAVTPTTVLALSRRSLDELAAGHATLRDHLARRRERPPAPVNKHGEAAIESAAGHTGEPDLPGSFVDYQLGPREHPLSVAQARLNVHTRVSDIYNDAPPARLRHRPTAPWEPTDQLAEQLRLTVAALRERQEHELLHDPEVGLLHRADPRQRLYPRTGPPTPDDLDQLLSRRRRTHLMLAHPRTIAAFGRECTRRGVYPHTVTVHGRPAVGWRGVPLLPCAKIPVSAHRTSAILAMRTGEQQQGVIGLHQAGLPGEYEPGVSVRRSGVDGKGIASYLVSTYYSVAVLVPDALGILEELEVGEA